MAEHGPMSEELAAATHELADLQAEVARTRADLAAVRRELTHMRQSLTRGSGTPLVEANEHLVLAALHAQSEAQDVRSDLNTLTEASQRDSLTGIPDRALMMDRLQNAIAYAGRNRTRLALLFVDLDNFKAINDTRGHTVGDAVLKEVAACLSAAVRQSDTVSRRGGDEFLLLLHEVTDQRDAGLVASKILKSLVEPGRFGDTGIRLTASIGIAMYPDDGNDAAVLIERADAAMYKAKQVGGAALRFHSDRLAPP
ncbi:MAG: GGDEF domain-containing protein [Burkholderiales bacterium]